MGYVGRWVGGWGRSISVTNLHLEKLYVGVRLEVLSMSDGAVALVLPLCLHCCSSL